jgi:hypothetical protein
MRIFGKNKKKIVLVEHFTPLLFIFHVLMRIGTVCKEERKPKERKSIIKRLISLKRRRNRKSSSVTVVIFILFPSVISIGWRKIWKVICQNVLLKRHL